MKIFINYRRCDFSGKINLIIDRITDRIAKEFEDVEFFHDKESAEAGSEFSKELTSRVKQADLFLSFIGPSWKEEIRNRSDKGEKDYVRDEIKTALDYNIKILPITIGGTSTPGERDLPTDINTCFKRNSIKIKDPENAAAGIEELIHFIKKETFSKLKDSHWHFPEFLNLELLGNNETSKQQVELQSNAIGYFDEKWRSNNFADTAGFPYVNYVWDAIIEKNADTAIRGDPGCGKSALLALLVIYGKNFLRRNCEYINLQHYDYIEPEEGARELAIFNVIEKHIDEIKKQGSSAEPLYLFIDGYNDKEFGKWSLQRKYHNALREIDAVRITAIGVDYDEYETLLPSKPKLYTECPSCLLYLKAAPAQGKYFKQAVEYLLSTHQNLKSACTSEVLLSRLEKFECRHVNLQLLFIALNASKEASNSIGQAIEEFVDNLTKKDDSLLQSISRYVHNVYLENHNAGGDSSQGRHSGPLIWHGILRSYCHAYFIIDLYKTLSSKLIDGSIRDSNELDREWRASRLNGLLFSSRTNFFCKWILASNESNVLRSLKVIIEINLTSVSRLISKEITAENSKEIARLAGDVTHIAYLLGRFVQNKKEAEDILKKLKSCYFSEEQSRDFNLGDHSSNDAFSKLRMLKATIIISQITITKKRSLRDEYSNEFLELLTSPVWRKFISQFHLEYHGDLPFTLGRTKHFSDITEISAPYNRFLDAIEPKLMRAIDEDTPYDLFNVDMSLLCVLANNRHQALAVGDIEWSDILNSCKERVIKILKKRAKVKVKQQAVYPIMRMTERFLSTKTGSNAFSFISKLFEMKMDTPRSGWITRLNMPILPVCESVADHTWSTMLLAEALLPEQVPNIHGEDYSKDRVIRIILVHDIPEAITGDIPASGTGVNRHGENEREEKNQCSTIEAMNTLDGILGMQFVSERWKEAAIQSSTNGIIANFFDKLDALYQLTIYSKIVASMRKMKSSKELASEWKTFFSTLHDEAITASDDLPPFLKEESALWIDWAEYEFNNESIYLHHEIMFKTSEKYYPHVKRKIRRGIGEWRLYTSAPPDQFTLS